MSSLLNKFYAALKVNGDLRDELSSFYKDNQLLAKDLKSEEILRKLNLEDSLDFGKKCQRRN